MSLRSWFGFCTRRSLNVDLFIRSYGLDTKEKFLMKLASMGVESPTENELVVLFPHQKKEDVILTVIEPYVRTVRPDVVQTVETKVQSTAQTTVQEPARNKEKSVNVNPKE